MDRGCLLRANLITTTRLAQVLLTFSVEVKFLLTHGFRFDIVYPLIGITWALFTSKTYGLLPVVYEFLEALDKGDIRINQL